jgi:hypothetical protein
MRRTLLVPASLVLMASAAVITTALGQGSSTRIPVYEIAADGFANNSGSVVLLGRPDGRLRRIDATSFGLVWSPDGGFVGNVQLGQTTETGTFVMTRDGKASQKIWHSDGTIESWSPRGDLILVREIDVIPMRLRSRSSRRASIGTDRYVLVRLADSKVWPIIDSGPMDGYGWMPDGTLLVAGSRSRLPGRSAVYAVRPDHTIRRLTPAGSDLGYPQVSKDGSTVVVWGRLHPGDRTGFWQLNVDASELRWIHKGRLDVHHYSPVGRLSPDGSRLAFECGGLCTKDLSSRQVRSLYKFGRHSEEWSVESIGWSPDSRLIAMIFSRFRRGRGSGLIEPEVRQITVIGSDGSDFHRLVRPGVDLIGPESADSPRWSPDSRWIAFTESDPRSHDFYSKLLVAPSDSSSDPVVLARWKKLDVRDLAWSPVPSSG